MHKLKKFCKSIIFNIEADNIEFVIKDEYKDKIFKVISSPATFNFNSIKNLEYYLYDKDGNYIRTLRKSIKVEK